MVEAEKRVKGEIQTFMVHDVHDVVIIVQDDLSRHAECQTLAEEV